MVASFSQRQFTLLSWFCGVRARSHIALRQEWGKCRIGTKGGGIGGRGEGAAALAASVSQAVVHTPELVLWCEARLRSHIA